MESPRELANERLKIAYEYSKLGERLVEIKKQKAVIWKEIRARHKSDKQADIEWESSELGLEEYEIKLKMKAKEHKLSAIRTSLMVSENEIKNLY